MGLLKKLKKTKSTPSPTVGKALGTIDKVAQLIERGLLRTTPHGKFYMYREIYDISTNKSSFLKNLYFYARTTKLVSADQPLDFHDIETEELIAQYPI